MQIRIIKYSACTLAIAAFVVVGMVLFGYANPTKSSASTASTSTARDSHKTASAIKDDETSARQLSGLVAELNTTIQTSGVSTAVSVIDLDNGKQYNAGLDVAFRGASTTKVLTAVDYMRLVEQGSASLDTQINGASAQVMLKSLLQQSNNAAWSAFEAFIGKSNLETYAHSIGMTSFSIADNTLQAQDEALLLSKLYQGKLITATHTQLLLSFMQDTDNEQLIPAALPADAVVHHKYGYLEGELHDAAIIRYQSHTFVLVIYTNNQQTTTDDYASRVALIHKLTDVVVADYAQD